MLMCNEVILPRRGVNRLAAVRVGKGMAERALSGQLNLTISASAQLHTGRCAASKHSPKSRAASSRACRIHCGSARLA